MENSAVARSWRFRHDHNAELVVDANVVDFKYPAFEACLALPADEMDMHPDLGSAGVHEPQNAAPKVIIVKDSGGA